MPRQSSHACSRFGLERGQAKIWKAEGLRKDCTEPCPESGPERCGRCMDNGSVGGRLRSPGSDALGPRRQSAQMAQRAQPRSGAAAAFGFKRNCPMRRLIPVISKSRMIEIEGMRWSRVSGSGSGGVRGMRGQPRLRMERRLQRRQPWAEPFASRRPDHTLGHDGSNEPVDFTHQPPV